MVEEINSICYVGNICSSKTYNDLFSESSIKPSQQAVKYHRLLAEGLYDGKRKVFVVGSVPPLKTSKLQISCEVPNDEEHGVCYRYISYLFFPVVKHVMVLKKSFCETKRLINVVNCDLIFVDVLSVMISLGAMLAAKREKRRVIAIVTDLPEMFANAKFHLNYYLSQFIIKHADGYSFMTKAMDERVNVKHLPSVIMEGHVDILENKRQYKRKMFREGFECIYAGAISKQYGLNNLVEGFIEAKLPNSRLHIYGNGSYVDELKQIAEKHKEVVYEGSKNNTEVVEAEYAADLLINPRPTNEEYVKYSFPSKNMEYMATGTPVLTTRLPGMPEEYENYVYMIEKEDSNGICEILTNLYEMDPDIFYQRGEAARDFVLNRKNNHVQADSLVRSIQKSDL